MSVTGHDYRLVAIRDPTYCVIQCMYVFLNKQKQSILSLEQVACALFWVYPWWHHMCWMDYTQTPVYHLHIIKVMSQSEIKPLLTISVMTFLYGLLSCYSLLSRMLSHSRVSHNNQELGNMVSSSHNGLILWNCVKYLKGCWRVDNIHPISV